MKWNRIIIIGATSGIGAALAREAHSYGMIVGATGRRTEQLKSLKNELKQNICIRTMDVTSSNDARAGLLELAEEMGGVDIVVLNAGVSDIGTDDSGQAEQRVIDVNVSGFIQLFRASWDYFERQGHGQIVGISSVASLLGYGGAAAYNASKAFISNYMQGYRQKARASGAELFITDIRPGYVYSEMTDGQKGMFWVANRETAAKQILNSILKRKSRAYVTRRWNLVAWLIKGVPDKIIDRLPPNMV
ncbi:MAG: SDR family NAD(P)-dependent oxidoreductase [Balneolaceae bacterium]